MSRGFKNFLGIVLACIALSALFSSPVGFFDVVVAVMCIIAAILLLKPTESEKAAKKAKQSGNESKSMPTANTTDTAIETVEPTQITTQNEGYYYEPEPPVKPIVEHYSRNDDVVYLRHENSLLRAQLSTDQGDLVDAKSEALKIRANVSLEEIKQVVRDNFDKSVEFVEIPPAEQYRESLLLREASEVHA